MSTPSGSTAVPWPFAALLVLLALFAAPSARAAWFYVGGDGGCNSSSIQTVLNSISSSGHEIRIARNATYSQQALTWNVAAGVTLTLTGGFADCNQFVADTTKTTLNGAGGAAAPVLRINMGVGATVILKNLTLRGGDPAGENPGGGLHITGRGTVRIEDSSITNNVAGNGGGIMIDGSGPGARLVIGSGVLIAFNEARFSGGGVFVAGAALDMLEDNSVIMLNSALGTPTTGYGGGLFVRARGGAPSLVRIGSTGQGNTGAIFGNEARAGGGIAIRNFNDDRTSTVEVFTNRVGRPAAVRDNFASVAGGGVFVQNGNDFNDRAILRLWNAEVSDNVAPDGAALYFTFTPITLNDDTGPRILVNSLFGSNQPQPPEGAVPCPPGVPCGEISGNETRDGNGNFTQGAIILVNKHVDLYVGTFNAPGGIAMRGNRGGRLIDVAEDRSIFDSNVSLTAALLVDNEVSLELIRDQSEGGIGIYDTTIAGNVLGAGRPVIRANNESGEALQIHRSIIAQPGHATLLQTSGTFAVSETISNGAAGLGGLPGAANLPPRFVDPERGDYRLRAASPAVDYAVGFDDGVDIGGSPRNVDLPFKPNAFGPRDIGAFERQTLTPLVLNGNFDTDLNLWPVANNDTVWDSDDSGGNPQSGSARVAGIAGSDLRLIGAVHCIHLPGPGRYRLNGNGRTVAASGDERDTVALGWRLRYDGNETCTLTPVDRSGEHVITRGSGWSRPVEGAVIDVPDTLWTPNASLLVSLLMIDAGVSPTREVTGWFDRITLTIEPLGDLIFADGFEDEE